MTGPGLVGEIAELLREIAGEDAGWRDRLAPDTRLDGDLFFDSVELAALGAALRRRYGAGVDLDGHVTALAIDEIIAFSLADVARYVAAHADPARLPPAAR